VSRLTGRRVRRVLAAGAVKWAPFLMLLFFVLFLETWLHTQTLRNGYEVNRINAAIQEVEAHVDQLKSEVATLKRMERIDAEAPNLGLVEPGPNQIVRIHAWRGYETLPTDTLPEPDPAHRWALAILDEELDRVSEETPMSRANGTSE